MKKYLFEFIAIFLGVIGAYTVEEWREQKNNELDTKKALTAIKLDLQRDTSLYHLRIDKILKRNVEYLKLGLKESMTVDELKKLHKGMRAAPEYLVYDHGYNYLINNVSQPTVDNDTTLMWLGYYYALSGSDGNYGRYNADFWRLTGKNYYDLFTVFPNFFSQDTVIANSEMRRQLPEFLADPYWQGRVRLTLRETEGLILPVFEKNLGFAESLLVLIEKELEQ